MFLCSSPKTPPPDALGPWPIYPVYTAMVALALFRALWFPSAR